MSKTKMDKELTQKVTLNLKIKKLIQTIWKYKRILIYETTKSEYIEIMLNNWFYTEKITVIKEIAQKIVTNNNRLM